MTNRRRQLTWLLALGGAAPGPVAAALCRLTEPSSLGPFYRRQAPFQSRLASPSEPGDPLVITGRVLAGDGCTPLADAVVDAWHANADGRYYNVGNAQDDEPGQFRLRGRIRTDSKGVYRFETIMPGNYSSRARHVHIIASHERARELVTQMYFSGDPKLENDWLARDSLVVNKTGDTATFDIVLST